MCNARKDRPDSGRRVPDADGCLAALRAAQGEPGWRWNDSQTERLENTSSGLRNTIVRR